MLSGLALGSCGAQEGTADAGAGSVAAPTSEPKVEAPELPEPRLLIVGWDGASFRHVDPLLRRGRLPNLARLIAGGAQANLVSTLVPISSAAWTSAFSGEHPGRTGVYGFFEPVPGTYGARLVDSSRSLAPPLWRILTARGIPSVVFGVPLTYPPEPILGTLVAGMLSPFDADYAWPPGTADALRERGFEPDLEAWTEVRELDPARFDRQLTIKGEVLRELLEEEGWRLAVVVFKSLDVFSHLAYGSDFASVVDPVYERLDRELGALLEVVGEDTDVLVLSDHGFRVYEAGVNLHAWLREAGFLAFERPESVWPVDPSETIARRELAALQGQRAALDWSRTRAFVQVTEGHHAGLRLNLAGREPRGCVDPGNRDEVLERLEQALLASRDAAGTPIFTRVWRIEELYPGPGQERLPDLVVEARSDLQVFAEEASPRVVGEYGTALPDHDPTGILVAAGPSIRGAGGGAPSARGSFAIEDVAPTALHLLGLPVLREMTGEVMLEILDAPEPVRTQAGDELEFREARGRAFRPDEIEELTERLGALGYGSGTGNR